MTIFEALARSIPMSRATITGDGPTEAEAMAEKPDKPEADQLAGLSPDDRKLVEGTLRTYPALTIAEAVEMLKEFGGL